MKIVGVDGDGNAVFDTPLVHGADPDILAWEKGYLAVRPLDAIRDPSGELIIRLLLRPLGGEPRPVSAGRGQDAGLSIPRALRPIVRQRLPATRWWCRPRTAGHPVLRPDRRRRSLGDAGRRHRPRRGAGRGRGARGARGDRRRTSCWASWSRSRRRTGSAAARTGPMEDFHAVRLIYRASCPEPGEPVVLDAAAPPSGPLGAAGPGGRWLDANWQRCCRAARGSC